MADEIGVGDSVRLAEVLGGLSLACDLADGFAPETVLRSALLAVELGKRIDLAPERLRDTFYASLLRYTGCTAFSHEEAHVYGTGDDIATRELMALADVAQPLAFVGSVVGGLGRGGPLLARVRAVASLLADGKAVRDHAAAQCEGATYMARLCGMGGGVIAALQFINERYDGRGVPAGTAGDALPWEIRLSHVADAIVLVHQRAGRDAALHEARVRSGGHFDPAIVAALEADASELFALLDRATVWEQFLASEPLPIARVPLVRLDDVARAFGHVADLKSTFLTGHSTSVAALAERAATSLGLDRERCERVRRAALLHDVGRVAVPTGIWDKPGSLSIAQWERVRLHAYYGERVLFQAPALRPLAAVASAAHERLDGSGYHRAIPASLIEREARLIAAADVYCALRADRPQRAALDPARSEALLREQVDAGRLDREAVHAVLAAAGHRQQPLPTAWPAGLSDREVEVLRRLARGRSNKQIASELGISPKTVQHHIAHVYEKIGTSSRAAATLFALEHSLLN